MKLASSPGNSQLSQPSSLISSSSSSGNSQPSQTSQSSSSSSSGQSTATRTSRFSDYDPLESQEEDPVWSVLVPIKRSKYQTYQLIDDSHSFGRLPSNDFMFHKKIHNLDKEEFDNISKFHFVVQKVGISATITDVSSNGTFVNGIKLPPNRAVPLPHLSIVSLAQPHNRSFQFYNRCHQKRQLDMVPSGFFALYTLEDIVLGTGGTGLVRKGFKNSDFNDKVAVKIIDKLNKNLRPDKDFLYEVNLIKDLNHPNIVRINDFFQNSHFVYIVMEYANQGDLLVYIQKNGPLMERTAKIWFRTVVGAVNYLHQNNIIHRDIKPQNVLLHKNADGNLVLKLADFGASRFLDTNSLCKTYAGTPLYWAPEVTNSTRGYSKEADLWSLGCLLYVLIVGENAFSGKVVIPAAIQHISNNRRLTDVPLARNLTLSLLNFSAKKRLKIEETYNHAWFFEDFTSVNPPSSKRQRTR